MKWIIRCSIGIGLIAMSMLSGCATFSGKENPEIEKLADKSSFSRKPSVSIDVKYVAGSTNSTMTPVENQKATEKLKSIVQQVSTTSDFFSQFSLDPFTSKDMDYTIKMEMLNHGSEGAAAISGFITGLSLFLIPASATDHFKLTANVMDRNGTIIKTYEVNDKVTTWIGIWFVPFMGSSSDEVVLKVWENMVKTIYQRIDQDKLMLYAQLQFKNGLLVLNLPH